MKDFVKKLPEPPSESLLHYELNQEIRLIIHEGFEHFKNCAQEQRAEKQRSEQRMRELSLAKGG